MKIMLRAAMAALSIASISPAFADGGAGPTMFTMMPGVMPQLPVQKVPPVATAQKGQVSQAYVTHSKSQGVWLFAPDQFGGGNQ